MMTSSVFVILAQAFMEIKYTTVFWPATLLFGSYTLLYLFYQALSISVNFTGRDFDLAGHIDFVRSWRPRYYPDVDIYLPICGEPIELLCNTWMGVSELIQYYPGQALVYVLDDGDSDEAKAIVRSFGFTYVRRPVHQYKKAGNLNYAFPRTGGEYIVVFDADFRPRRDFLSETLPYMDDPNVGIVQTPQFFRVSPGQSWIERAAGALLEVFYRAVQMSRDRFGSALCVGSNAVYRRAALQPSGGFALIPYAEDSHTGLDMRYHGYQLRYLPVILAAGICPDNIDAFMRQQYRWCCGATSLIWTSRMWRVPMQLRSRLPYLAGWLWNLTTAVRAFIMPLIPVTLLVFLPGTIRLRNAVLLIPAAITSAVLYPMWHNCRWPLGAWPLAIAVGWAQALSLWDYGRGKVMSWQPTRGPAQANRRFRIAVVAWNGTLGLAWPSLALWRMHQAAAPSEFAIVCLLGIVNLLIVFRIIFSQVEA